MQTLHKPSATAGELEDLYGLYDPHDLSDLSEV